jgi:hypothetical protein
MPKIKITNLKFGACVINSLRLTIPGKASVVRDASILGDPDLSELESEGVISVTSVEDAKPAPPPPAPKPQPVQAAKQTKPQPGKKPQQGKKAPAAPPAPQQPPKPKEKPGTSFRMVDGPEDEMGRKVVIMGEDGPIVKKMGPGINGSGPKFVGDQFEEPEPPEPADGFSDVT